MAGQRKLELSCFALLTLYCVLVKGQVQQNQQFPRQQPAGQPFPGQQAGGQAVQGQQPGGQPLPGQHARGQPLPGQQAGGQPLPGQQAGGQRVLGQPAGNQQFLGQQQVQQPKVKKILGKPYNGQVVGQQLLGQQGQQGQQAGAQQLPGDQKLGQALPKQQGSLQGQKPDAAFQKQDNAQNVNSFDIDKQKAAGNGMNVQGGNLAGLNVNQQNAKPAVQSDFRKNVQNNQQVDPQNMKKDNQLIGLPVVENAKPDLNNINNVQAWDKRQNRVETGGQTGQLNKNVENINDAGAKNSVKIPDLHGNVKDSSVYKPKEIAQSDNDLQQIKGVIKDDTAKVRVAGGGRFDIDQMQVNQGKVNQDGNKDTKVEAGDLNRVDNKVVADKAGDTGKLPEHIKIIDGEVEKNKDTDVAADVNDDGDDDGDEDEDDEDDDYYDNSPQRADTKLDSGVINAPAGNEYPKAVEVQVGKDKTLLIPNQQDNANVDNNEIVRNGVNPDIDRNVVKAEPDKEKEGSLKVVWDWSDFAVNFEQYVMPEQKIRRAPHATTGEPWPMPQYYVTKKDKVYTLNKSSFKIKLSKVRCDIIEKAIERYKFYIFEDAVEDMYDNFQHAQSTMFEDPTTKYEQPLFLEAPYVTKLDIKIRKPCAKFPHAKSDESYDLFVKRTGVHLWANEVWGALRGLETFSQLVFKGTNQQLYVRDTVINDYPRFSHRGVMIDSSRHFIFKETIYDVLEGMAQNKMNVMHWHLVDDQSFPFYSQVYPDLSAKGAFHPTFVYMPEDIADIIEFARVRGIRVEPEFDTPGHTYSWGLSRPDLLTQCYQGDRPVDGYVGPMDPSKNETFRFLSTFFKDVLHVFKDQYIHLGGDEVPMTCWQSNPEVLKFLGKLEGRTDMNQHTNDPYYYSYDIRKLLEYYVTRLIKDLKNIGSKRSNGVRMVFWQEIMNNDVQLPNDTIIHVWQGGMEDVQRATSLNLNVIYSTCWYLDLIEYGTKWSKYYQCDPADTSYGYTLDESKVLGGEACLWAEYIDNENLMTTLWPRASAAGERLWSNKDVRDLDAAATRLQEHRCRMLSRGLGVGQISGPDYCLRRGKRRHQVNETASNCTQSQCAAYTERGRVEVEKIKVEFEQKGGRMSDCSQAVVQAGSQLTLLLLIFIVIAVVITLKFSRQKIIQVRMCRNKSILFVFITLILIYFMCYTSVWMQAMQFKGSFEKRVSSNIS